MFGHYEIVIDNSIYNVDLVDNKAKITWEKGESGLVFKKKLEGNFVLNRSGNEECYDAIMAMQHWDEGALRLADSYDSNIFFVVSVFNIRDITFNVDKCQMTIKPRYYDPYNTDAILDKDYNIINNDIGVHSITYMGSYLYEYVNYSKEAVNCPDLSLNEDDKWESNTNNSIPVRKVFNGEMTTSNVQNDGFTYYSQLNTNPVFIELDGVYAFDITTTWFREIKYTAYAIDPTHSNPPPQGTSGFPFTYHSTFPIGNPLYHKWVRNVDNLTGPSILDGDSTVNNPDLISWSLSSYYGLSSLRTLTRARKLNDILDHFSVELNCASWSSQFFKDSVNPVSGNDLSNLMIMQKSDAMFVDGIETSNPATLGVITFKQLMQQLWAMFQVTWLIQDSVLYIEHIRFFKENFSYDAIQTVGLDLTVEYPEALKGTFSYSYDNKVALREKFSFAEAWNWDFVGTDINYVDYISDGETEDYLATLITTDIDPTYLDNASKEGFVLFHCDSDNRVISTIGQLTQISLPNAHLGWANLHNAYWRHNRQLPIGNMNNEAIGFSAPQRKRKKQIPIRFPYCVDEFEPLINMPVRTTMGDGEIMSAEYEIRTGHVTIELAYL